MKPIVCPECKTETETGQKESYCTACLSSKEEKKVKLDTYITPQGEYFRVLEEVEKVHELNWCITNDQLMLYS